MTPPSYTHMSFQGRLVMIGFGSIGQGVLPLILRHLDVAPERVTIVTAEANGQDEAARYGIGFVQQALTPANYLEILRPLLGAGDFLLNLSVEVSSVALVEFARDAGALYLDTCVEPWPGGYTDPALTHGERTNYAMRAHALTLKRPGAPTAVLSHGANPGLVSHLVKEALLNIARDTDLDAKTPQGRAEWAKLAQRVGVKVIHVAERDTQVGNVAKQAGEFVNTWSIDGFVSEGCQPAELGWGSHEKHFPPDGRSHDTGCRAAIYLMRPGAATRVRTWTPLEGPFHGFLITHNEAISIADYYTVGREDAPDYRPTVHYAYHPCDDAVKSVHELAGKNWQQQATKRLMRDEIVSGVDELGVLLAGHSKNAYWYGSQLSVEEARALAPYNNATSLQVCAAVLAGMVWALERPTEGVVEADEMDHARCMQIMRPYLGRLVGVYTDWTPLADRETLFPEEIDRTCPWQFQNVRVV